MDTINKLDIYKIDTKIVNNNLDSKVLYLLYQPIIGSLSITLYMTLFNDYNKDISYTHEHILNIMDITLKEFIEARMKLEAIGLLKTYVKPDTYNNYIYILYSPLEPSEFINNPLLNNLLYSSIKPNEYKHLITLYKNKIEVSSSYTDITKKFDKVFYLKNYNLMTYENDIIKNDKNSIELENKIDINFLKENLDKNVVSINFFNKNSIEAIEKLSYLYSIDSSNIINIIKASLDNKGNLDIELFRTNTRNYYEYNNSNKTVVVAKKEEINIETNSKNLELIKKFENTNPRDFLEGIGSPTTRDLKLIDDIISKYDINFGVLNVLIDYVLKINNAKLNKDYIEAILGQWQRKKITNVIDAIELARSEYKKYNEYKNKTTTKKYNSTVKKETKVPEWFDKNVELETNVEDEAYLKELLKDFK